MGESLDTSNDSVAATVETPSSQAASSSSVDQMTPTMLPNTNQNKRKRVQERDNIPSVLSTATNVLESIAQTIKKPTTSTEPNHVDLFFRSLAAQFPLIEKAKQPYVMLKLQQIITEAQLVPEANNPTNPQFQQTQYIPEQQAGEYMTLLNSNIL